LDRGGLVGEDGPTHHGALDLSYLSSIQEMVVAAPRSGQELRNLIRTGLLHKHGPFAIRYPRDKAPDMIDWTTEPVALPVGSWEVVREGRKVLVLAVGTMVEAARRAMLKEELNVTLVNCRFVKPMDIELLARLLLTHDSVLTIEEGTGHGGFDSQVATYMLEHDCEHPFRALHLPDEFIEHGSREKLLEICGLSDDQIGAVIRELLKADPKTATSARAAVLRKKNTEVL
jgi:1-deoxy-D-xylulose-5-phosphate synthase